MSNFNSAKLVHPLSATDEVWMRLSKPAAQLDFVASFASRLIWGPITYVDDISSTIPRCEHPLKSTDLRTYFPRQGRSLLVYTKLT